MSTKHEIVLIDGGDDVGATTDFTATSDASPTVSPRTDSPRWKGDPGQGGEGTKGPSAGESAAKVIETINKTLGGSPLINAATQLTRAFSDIYSNVENIARKAGAASPPASPPVQPQQPAQSSPGGKASSLPSPEAKPTKSPAIKPQAKEYMPGGGGNPGPATHAGAPPVPVARPPIPVPAAGAAGLAGPAAGAATAAQGMTALATGLTIAGGVIGGFTVAVAAGAIATKKLFDVLGEEVKRLEGVSADVSVAASMNEVRREMADMRRADKIGPDLARFENMRGKLEDKWYDLGTEVKAILLKVFDALAPALVSVINGISVATANLELVNANIEAFQAMFTAGKQDDLAAALAQSNAMVRAATAMNRFVDGQEDKEQNAEDPFLNGFLAQFAGGQI